MIGVKGDYPHRRCAPIQLASIVAALLLVAISASASGQGRRLQAQTVGFHSALLKKSTAYLYMGRKTLSLHIHNGTDRAITQAMIELIAYWPPDAKIGETKRHMDFDHRYRLISARPGGIAPYSNGVLTVDWDSDVKAGTKDDPIVPTKVLHAGDPVFLYGDEIGDPPHVQAWLQNEMVDWKGISVTFSGAPLTRANRREVSLFTPIPEGQRPKRASRAGGNSTSRRRAHLSSFRRHRHSSPKGRIAQRGASRPFRGFSSKGKKNSVR